MVKEKKYSNLFWFHRPSRKVAIIFTVVFLVSAFLNLAAASDLFTQNPFQRRYLPILILQAAATLAVIKLWMNYFQNSSS